PHDPTPPLPSWLGLNIGGDRLKVYMRSPSVDWESGFKGFHYGISSSSSEAVQRASRNDYISDRISQYGDNNSFLTLWLWRSYGLGRISAEYIRTFPASSLNVSLDSYPEGPLYFAYRIFNRQNVYSTGQLLGPFYHDTSVPSRPTARSTNSGLSLTNIKDDESGIKKIEYSASGLSNDIAFTVHRDFTTPSFETHSLFLSPSQIINPQGSIIIRITNGVGKVGTYVINCNPYTNQNQVINPYWDQPDANPENYNFNNIRP
ncbi:MAG: hypothetical protein ACOCXH_10425, partial [Cyclobacteriaceae bacterium]